MRRCDVHTQPLPDSDDATAVVRVAAAPGRDTAACDTAARGKATRCSSAGDRTRPVLRAPRGDPHSSQNSQRRTDTKLGSRPHTSRSPLPEQRLRRVQNSDTGETAPGHRRARAPRDPRPGARVCSAHGRSVCWVPPALSPVDVTAQGRFGNEAEAWTPRMVWRVSVCDRRREAQRRDRIIPTTG